MKLLDCLTSILSEVVVECIQQDKELGEQRHPNGTGGFGADLERTAARRRCEQASEDGEQTWKLLLAVPVTEAFAESDPERIRVSLVQAMAVIANWVEHIDRQAEQENACG